MVAVQVQAELTGFSGAPGINTWFISGGWIGAGDEPEQAGFILEDFANFYTGASGLFQSDVTIQMLGELRVVDEATGQTTQVVVADDLPDPIQGSSPVVASHATMLKTQIRTGVFVDGRQIRGGVFLGPMGGDSIQENGDILLSTRTNVADGLNVLADAIPIHGASLGVYRRPRPASDPLGARAGAFAEATGFGVFSRPAVLRSRRD